MSKVKKKSKHIDGSMESMKKSLADCFAWKLQGVKAALSFAFMYVTPKEVVCVKT